MPPGPSSTTVPFYLPAGYHMSAFPGYPKIATHKINTAYRSNQGLVATKAGLHSKPAKVEVSNAHWKDLEKKEELLDYLEDGTEVIVFNEACGYHGLWAEVIVVGENGFHTYQDSEVVDGAIISSDLKRQFVMFSDLERLPETLLSHPMVEPSQRESFNYNILPSPWRNKTPEVPFYDTHSANISVVVERDATIWSGYEQFGPGENTEPIEWTSQENTQTLMRKALEEGLRIIFEHYQKEIPEGLFPELELFASSEAAVMGVLARDTSQYDKFFIFARAEEFHLEARPNAPLKVLVTIPQKYFDTYDVKDESQSYLSKFKDDTAEAKATLNKYLDSNSGLINTDVLRELLPAEEIQKALGHEEWKWGVNIFGEEIVWLEKDALATSITDPEALNARSQERMAQANEEIESLPETLYEKYVSEDVRESIENTIGTVGDALAELELDANDLTAGTQNLIDIVNTVQQTLGAAPEFDATSDALFSTLTDPTVSMENLPGAFESEIQKRKFADQDLDTVLPRIEGTLLEKQYHNLISNKLSAETELPVGPPAEGVAPTDATLGYQNAVEAVKQIEKTIKKVKFYVSITTDELKDGTEKLKTILENLEDKRWEFQGDVEGWQPRTDSRRITEAYDEIEEYIIDQGKNNTPKIEWQLAADATYDYHGGSGGSGPYVELAFTNAHSLVYIGYSSFSPSRAKWLTMHRYDTGGGGTELQVGGSTVGDVSSPLGLSSFDRAMRGNAPLDSETIMAYIWKLNDIVNDPLSNSVPLTRWGLKYVHPRPRFIPKPKPETDISKERKKNKTLLNELDQKEMQLHRKNAERVARVALAATYAIEEPVDTVIASSNSAIRKVNKADDWINNFFDSVSTHDPYTGALIKCVVPTLDLELLPEIPDFDLQFLRNPILKLLELYNTLMPKGDLLEGIRDAILYAIMQAIKIIYATAIKLLLETLTALCLQIQAGVLDAIAAGLSLADPAVNLLSDDAASDVSISGTNSSTQSALRDSATLNSFKEIGVFPLQGFHEAESIRMIKDLFVDVSGMLTAVEICQLTSANPPNHVVEIVKSLIKFKHPHFIDHLNNKSKIIDLFAAFGKYVDQKLCDDIITANENNTIYNSNYKDLYCSVNTELDQARKSLLSCNPSLTEDMIDDIVTRENKNNLEVAKNLINNFNSDTIKDLLQPLSLENDAIDFVNGTAIETMFEPVDVTLKRELKEFPPHMYDLAAKSLPQVNGEFQIPTELMASLKEQYKNIESNEVFQILEEEDGFIIKLLSPASFVNGSDKKFELLYKLYNRKSPRTDQVFPEFVEGIVPTASPTTDNVGKDKYSLILRNPEALLNGEIMNTFKYTKKFDPPIFVKDYIEQNFQNVDLTVTNATPQQVYFSKFLLSKLPSGTQLSTAQQLALPIERSGGLSLFLQYGVFSQITRDILAFLGRKVADSKYFEVSPSGTSNLELLEFSSFDFLNLEKIKSEALKKFKKNYYDDLPEPRDGTIQRESYNSFEVANLEQCIKTIIRVYILEFFIKSIFSSSTFKLSEGTEEVLHDYILKRMEKDIPAQFSRIFNYKFFYLARGIYQDNLEAPIEGSDLFYKKAIKKYIAEEYKDIADTFDQLTKEPVSDQTPIEVNVFDLNNQSPSLQGVSVADRQEQIARGVGVGLPVQEFFKSNTATKEFLKELPIKDAYRHYQLPEDFIGEDNENLKNGNFYFERYLKITNEDGTSKIIAPNDFQHNSSTSAVSYGLRLVYLFPYGDLYEKGVKVTEPEGIANPLPKYLIDLDEASENFDKIFWGDVPVTVEREVTTYYIDGEWVERSEPPSAIHYTRTETESTTTSLYKRHVHVVTMANVEYQYEGNVEDFRNAFYLFDEVITNTNYGPWHSKTYSGSNNLFDSTRNHLTGDDGLREKILDEIDNLTPEKKVALAKYWEEHGLGIGLLLHDSDWQYDMYWSTNIPNNPPVSVDYDPDDYHILNQGKVLKSPTQSLENYITKTLGDFYINFRTYVSNIENVADVESIVAKIVWPDIETVMSGSRFPDADLHQMMDNNQSVNFLFNYIFPIEKYKTLMSIYNVESMNEVPGLDMMFSETKDTLRTLFNVIDSRGRFNYAGPTNIDNIRKKKIESQLPTILLPGLDIELEYGVSQPVQPDPSLSQQDLDEE